MNDATIGHTELDFGEALKLLKDGKRVARRGWNGKGQYVYLRRATNYDEPVLVIHTAQDKTQPGWLASQSDMLATDWEMVL